LFENDTTRLAIGKESMNPELPRHLHSTRDLLMGSLRVHQTEKASEMPAELLSDLSTRFEATAAVRAPSLSWFEKIQSFIARPAFGVAALATVILGLALPGILAPAPTGSGFRGAATSVAPAESIRILLVKAPADFVKSLENSGNFELGAIFAVSSIPTGPSAARVIVDFAKSEISAIAADGTVISTDAFPADSAALSRAIAVAVSRL
jgi:hypothetical protein